MNDEPRPQYALHESVRRELNDLLLIDGMRLSDTDVPVPPERAEELDADTIIIRRDDDTARTVCFVSRPANEQQYVRQDIYAVWDSGKTAFIPIRLGPEDLPDGENEIDRSIYHALTEAHDRVMQELLRMVRESTMEDSEALAIHSRLLEGIQQSYEVAEEAMLRAEELNEGSALDALDEVAEAERRTRQAQQSILPSARKDLHELIESAYDAQYRTQRVLFQLRNKAHHMSEAALELAEAQPVVMPNNEAWRLLELLDALKEN